MPLILQILAIFASKKCNCTEYLRFWFYDLENEIKVVFFIFTTQ